MWRRERGKDLVKEDLGNACRRLASRILDVCLAEISSFKEAGSGQGSALLERVPGRSYDRR